jgi:Beta-propeller repeat
MRSCLRCLAVALLLVPATIAGGATGTSPRTPTSNVPAARPQGAVPRPLHFVENGGQTDGRVALYARTPAGTVWFTQQGLTYGFVRKGERWAVKVDFVGARADVVPEGRGERPTRVSYLSGNPGRSHADLRTYREVVYRGLWPGVDLVYESRDGGLKYTFEVAAGADPSAIAFDVRGATECSIDAGRRLRVATPMGGLVDDRPVAWQETPEGRRPVEAAFALARSRVRFGVGAYDASLPLTIDPPTYVYAGFLGGAGTEFAGGIAVDAQGSAYVTGRTSSDETTFPEEAGFDMTYAGGGADAFVAKVSPAGDDLVYVTYLGGTGFEMATGIRVTADGSAVVCGFTGSQADFPVLGGPDLTWGGGAFDGFVTKLDPAGTALVWSGFVGGLSDQFGWDDVPASLELDETGRAYVVGTTTSTQATFPTTGGALDATHNGGSDVYVVVVAADGSGFEHAGFLGGAGSDTGTDIAVAADHRITICGQTTDGGASFPKLVGPDLTYGGGTQDGFVARFGPSATLQWCGFWGGAFVDFARGVDVDDAGNAYVVGHTTSDESSFPLVNATDAIKSGSFDACFAEVKADGTGFLVSSYLGGAASDEGNDVHVSGDGKTLYLFGTTASSEATFPVKDGSSAAKRGSPKAVSPCEASVTFGGDQDGYVCRYSKDPVSEALTLDACLYVASSTAREECSAGYVADDAVFFAGHKFAGGSGMCTDVGPELADDGNEECVVGKLEFNPDPYTGLALFQFFLDAFGPARGGTVEARGSMDVPDPALFGDTLTLGVGTFSGQLGRAPDGPDGEIRFVGEGPDGEKRVFVTHLVESSRCPVELSLDDAVVEDQDGQIVVTVETGGVRARAVIDLDGGRFKGGSTVGAQVEPWIVMTGATATVPAPRSPVKASVAGKHSLAVKCRFATDGTRPPVAPPFTCRFGDRFDVTIPAESMKPKGKYVFAGQAGTARVVLDFKKGVGTFSAKDVDLGAFAQGANAVAVGVTLGTEAALLDLTMRLDRKKLTW